MQVRPATDSPCDRSRPRLPDVVQPLASAPPAADRHRRRAGGFLIDEILRPDFGRRRPAATPVSDRRHSQFSAVRADHVTASSSIWQPYAAAASPARPLCGPGGGGAAGGGTATPPERHHRMKKSACTARKSSRARCVAAETNCTAAAAAAAADKPVAVSPSRHHSPSRSSSSSASSSSSGSSGGGGGGTDVSAASSTTDSSTDVTASTTSASRSLQLGQFALPAWVYCTRYSDRPSSGMSSI